MEGKLVPYVGVTGFMSCAEADHVLDHMAIGSSRVLMTGVLASYKTLSGHEPSQPGRYPVVRDIEFIFPMHPRSLNLIHYNTRELATLYDQLQRLKDLAGRWFSGFQLNIKWPPLQPLQEYIRHNPDAINVLQLGRGAMQYEDNDPVAIARRARSYEDVVKYVLIDPSGGRGEPLDYDFARRLLRELYRVMPDVQMGVAGGLSAATINDLIGPLVSEFPFLCIDAEGGLRTEDDKLVLSAADDYVNKTLKLFARGPS